VSAVDPFPPKSQPVNWCKPCDEQQKTEHAYNLHLKNKHNMRYFSYGKSRPAGVKHYCKYCDEIYMVTEEYKQHLIMVHKLLRIPESHENLKIANPHLKPDPYNRYHYCNACEFTFFKVKRYKIRLINEHQIEWTPQKQFMPVKKLRKLNTMPDMNHPDYYCTVCERQYGKTKFRWHLYHCHRVIHPEIRGFFMSDNEYAEEEDEQEEEDYVFKKEEEDDDMMEYSMKQEQNDMEYHSIKQDGMVYSIKREQEN
jgi:hypothetical protein